MVLNPANQQGFQSSAGIGGEIRPGIGTYWELSVRYDLPGSVVAQNQFIYRQVYEFDDNVNVALKLAFAFLEDTNNPWVHVRGNQASTVETSCVLVRNLSENLGFLNVFTASDLPGLGTADMVSSQMAHRIVLQSSDGSLKHRKSIYFGGLDENKFTDGRIQPLSWQNFNNFIIDNYTLQIEPEPLAPLENAFVWQYGEVNGEYYEAAGCYTTTFTTRLKGRQGQAC